MHSVGGLPHSETSGSLPKGTGQASSDTVGKKQVHHIGGKQNGAVGCASVRPPRSFLESAVAASCNRRPHEVGSGRHRRKGAQA
jgi:hypothetical protein